MLEAGLPEKKDINWINITNTTVSAWIDVFIYNLSEPTFQGKILKYNPPVYILMVVSVMITAWVHTPPDSQITTDLYLLAQKKVGDIFF